MTGITAACTCSVDGWSGSANTRYQGYSFTGCGAHVDYTLDLGSGAGYERVWCYVTSPPDCPGGNPYIPEGFKTDNTLPEWEANGAAWKECYDGYRCEAWWGSLEGSPVGEPVVLDAPLDWPDCCALCSNSGGDNTTTSAADECEAWSFDPSTGSCQLMSAVQSTSENVSWAVNSTVHGYPGYFEAPITDCWGRTQYDLCVNTNVALIVPGVIVAFLSLLCFYCCAVRDPSRRYHLMRNILTGPEPRLVKAACLNVTANRNVTRGAKGKVKISYSYHGTFITRDGGLHTCPSRMDRSDRYVEEKMLKVLFSTRLNPWSDPSVATRCQTTDGLRSEYSKMVAAAVQPARKETGTINNPAQNAASRRFDCLLLMGKCRTSMPGRSQSTQEDQVLLVGILGEDRITCVNNRDERGLDMLSFCCLIPAAATLVTLCITLLTNEAAQNMARWTFAGDHRVGAIVGLVLCASVPLALVAWVRHRRRKLAKFIETAPTVAIEAGATSRT
ncbi:unnamed protein product [Scytosiphon promiscuus]